MANAVFYYKPDSPYDDIRGVRHHFPKRYLGTVRQAVGDWIAYYGPVEGLPNRYYTAIAKITDLVSDENLAGHFYAVLDKCIDFDRPLNYLEGGGYETGLIDSTGKPNGGRVRSAIRPLSKRDFATMIAAGFSDKDDWPARTDELEDRDSADGFSEISQTPLTGTPEVRRILSYINNRPFRETKFRLHIRKLYDRTCSFTGLRLINGKGRPEVEAAHIIPVEHGGNDSVQNGIALSGTVHWMFDRGLLSLSDNYDILVSRQLNYDVSHLLNKNLKASVPSNQAMRPHPHYLEWHRTNCFKT